MKNKPGVGPKRVTLKSKSTNVVLVTIPGVGLVDADCELIPDALDSQVLSDWLELVTGVVVVRFRPPLGGDHFQGPGQDWDRSDHVSLRSRGETKEAFFEILTRPDHVDARPSSTILFKFVTCEQSIKPWDTWLTLDSRLKYPATWGLKVETNPLMYVAKLSFNHKMLLQKKNSEMLAYHS